ncbi:MAG TPA: hypothetical protein VG603_15980 [Chitinophagales bacterium]|nr:hypothetical protein [Chitinophagales bacterium]
MALTILPNQALAMRPEAANKCNTRYYLPCQRGDNYTLQGISTPASDADLLNTDQSWSTGAGFTINVNSLVYTGNATATSAVHPLGLQPGHLYQLFLYITVTDAGTCTSGQGLIVKLNGVNVPLPGIAAGQGIHESFQLTWFYSPGAIDTGNIEVTVNNTSVRFVFTAHVIQYSIPQVTAYSGDTRVQVLDPVAIHYFTTPDYINDYGDISTCRFDIKFGLDQLDDGCYYIEIDDGSFNVPDPGFNDGAGWVVGANWSISNHAAHYTGNNSNQQLVTNIYLYAGQQYTLYFDCIGINQNGVTVEVDFADSTTTSQSYTGSSTSRSFTFSCPTGATGIAILRFAPLPSINGTCNFSIYNIHTGNTAGFTSNDINLRTTWGNTHLFSATNNDGAFGFDYSQGLTHTLRLYSRVKYHDYHEETEQYNFSDNSNVLMMATQEKVYEVLIGDAAEFVHNCLSLLRLHDHFYIDGEEYIKEGGYALKQRKSTELSAAAFSAKPIAGVGKNWALE